MTALLVLVLAAAVLPYAVGCGIGYLLLTEIDHG